MMCMYTYLILSGPLLHTHPEMTIKTSTKLLISRPKVKTLIYTRRSPKVIASPQTQTSTVSSTM